MKKNQKNKHSMYIGVAAHLDRNSSLFSSNEEFVSHVTSFKTVTHEIELKEAERSKAIMGKTRDKIQIRKALTTHALGIAGALYAYAKKSGNITMMESTKFRRTQLDNFRDNVLVIEMNSIKTLAAQNSEALARFGISAEKLESFANIISQYSGALSARDSGRALKTGANKSLATLFAEADSAVDSIDRLMENYAGSEAEFYNGYKAARVIRNLGVRHEAEEPPAAPEQEQVVAK